MDAAVMARQRSAMERFDLDALVAVSADNVAYGAGYVVPSMRLSLRNRQFAAVADRNGGSAMLLTSNEVDEAKDRAAIHELHGYDEFADDPMRVLADIVLQRGLDGRRVGVELDALSAQRWESLRQYAPGVRWEPAAEAFATARMIKTPAEVQLLRKAAKIAMQAQMDARAQFGVGTSEREAYRLVVDRILELGGEDIVMIQVATGERSLYSNPAPSDRRFQRGDTVKFDVFLTLDGYLSDTGRTIVIGEASGAQRQAWGRVEEVLAVLRDAVRPGATTGQLWKLFVREFGRRDMDPAIRFLGHGLGLGLHEEPFIAAHTDTELQPGMVFAIEPIYVEGDCGYHIEDILLVTENGHENFTPDYGTELVVC